MSRTFQTGGTGVKMVRSRFGIAWFLILFKAGVTDKTDNIGRVWFFDFHPASANGAAHGSVLHQLDGLEAGLFQEGLDHGGTEGFFEGLTVERLAGAGDDVGGVLVAFQAFFLVRHPQDFGAEFVRLARAVYHENDDRARIKKEINQALGSAYVEEKSYQDYGAAG